MEELILLRLGFSSNEIDDELVSWLGLVEGEYRTTRAIQILASLDDIDAKINESEEDSVLMNSCDGSFNWPSQLRHYRRRAHELLKELSRLLNVELKYSKYVKSGRLSFLSY